MQTNILMSKRVNFIAVALVESIGQCSECDYILVGNWTRVVATNRALLACFEHVYKDTRITGMGVWLGELRLIYTVATN
jgi:hypothetical protein